jgi:hypothetical protein
MWELVFFVLYLGLFFWLVEGDLIVVGGILLFLGVVILTVILIVTTLVVALIGI